MPANVHVKISGKKGTCSLTCVLIVDAYYTVISWKVADQIDPFEMLQVAVMTAIARVSNLLQYVISGQGSALWWCFAS